MAQNKTFSYTEAFRFAARTFIDNFSVFLSFFAVIFGLMCILIALDTGVKFWLHIPLEPSLGTDLSIIKNNLLIIATGMVYSIFYYLLFFYYGYQILRAGFALYDNKVVQWKDFFAASHFFRYLGAILWFTLKIFAGLMVFILPGIYIATKYWFTGYSLVDNRSHSIDEDAMFAAHVSKNVLWRILGLVFIYGFILMLWGLLIHQLSSPLFPSPPLRTLIDQLFKILLYQPLTFLTSIHVYKQLLSSSTQETPPAAQAEDGPSQA